MMKKQEMLRFTRLILAIAGFVLMSGNFIQTNAQVRDPFGKPGWAKPRTPATPGVSSGQPKAAKPKPPGPPPILPIGAPPIDQRISYYKRLREDAASSGMEIPKVTSVLTLDEMSIIGIFRTPRGYAAMVQAQPINLSYTIYPGEKFFDGQLVAVEENRLIFRKVTKLSNGKFTASVENKTLRQYTVQEEVQGTAPVQTAIKTETANSAQPQPSANQNVYLAPATTIPVTTRIMSPLEEMAKQPIEQPTDSAKAKKDSSQVKKNSVKGRNLKKEQKPVKVAENKDN
jgi:hypothetical protein